MLPGVSDHVLFLPDVISSRDPWTGLFSWTPLLLNQGRFSLSSLWNLARSFFSICKIAFLAKFLTVSGLEPDVVVGPNLCAVYILSWQRTFLSLNTSLNKDAMNSVGRPFSTSLLRANTLMLNIRLPFSSLSVTNFLHFIHSFLRTGERQLDIN